MRNLWHPVRLLRIGLALFLGLSAFLLMAITLVVLASCYHLLRLGNIRRSPLIRFPRWYAVFAMEICYRRLLGLQVRTLGDGIIRHSTIVLANHPSTSVLIAVVHFVAGLGPRIVVVMKSEHRNNVMGRALELIGAAIFVDRTDRTTALAAIKSADTSDDGMPTVYLIFPDGKRPTTKNLENERAKRIKSGASDLGLQHLLAPRYGGTLAILQKLPKADLLFVRSTLPHIDDGLTDVPRLFGQTLWIEAMRIPRPTSLDPASVQGMLNHHWRETDRWIAHHRGHHAKTRAA